MYEYMIGIKELYQTLPKIAEAARKGRSFLVVKHNKPIFRIEPVETARPKKKKNTMAQFAALQFRGGDPMASKEIDRIVYGV
ncbi:MAG: hypothetical protein AAB932_04810 [Patescibacteria group bacterium]